MFETVFILGPALQSMGAPKEGSGRVSRTNSIPRFVIPFSTRSGPNHGQKSCNGECAHSAEKTAENRSKPLTGCLNTPISSNGNRFLCSKSCFGLLLGHWFRAPVGPGMAGKGANRGSTHREIKLHTAHTLWYDCENNFP